MLFYWFIYLCSIQRRHFRRGQLSLCWVFKSRENPWFPFPFPWRSEQLLHQQSAFCPLVCVFCYYHSVGPLFLLDCEEVCFVFVWLLHCYDNSNIHEQYKHHSCAEKLWMLSHKSLFPVGASKALITTFCSVIVPTSACASPPPLSFLSCHQILSTMN